MSMSLALRGVAAPVSVAVYLVATSYTFAQAPHS